MLPLAKNGIEKQTSITVLDRLEATMRNAENPPTVSTIAVGAHECLASRNRRGRIISGDEIDLIYTPIQPADLQRFIKGRWLCEGNPKSVPWHFAGVKHLPDIRGHGLAPLQRYCPTLQRQARGAPYLLQVTHLLVGSQGKASFWDRRF